MSCHTQLACFLLQVLAQVSSISKPNDNVHLCSMTTIIKMCCRFPLIYLEPPPTWIKQREAEPGILKILLRLGNARHRKRLPYNNPRSYTANKYEQQE